VTRAAVRGALAIAALAITGSAATADTARLVVAGGASDRGVAVRGEVDARLGSVHATLRADDSGARLTALAGIGPRVSVRRGVATRWDRACLEALAAPGGRSRCWIDGATRAPVERARSTGWFGAVAGVRRDDLDRTAVVAALRIHPTDDVLGDILEVGASGVIAGRDRLFVQHMRFAPGWYARAQLRFSYIVVGAEVGMTGLAARTTDGAYRAEVFAGATIGFGVGL
jgi:hypothetical protein